jgi:fibronectin-binding autotransporter adhesin
VRRVVFLARISPSTGTIQTESPGDGLVVIGGTFTTTTYNFTEIAEGNVILVTESSGTATITYTGLESVINNSTSGDTVFNLRDLENQDVTLVDNTDPGLMDLTGSTFTDVTFAAPTTSLTIHGGSLADSFAVTSVDSAFRASLIIDGGDGSDTIHVNTNLTLGSATSAGNLTLTAETIRVSADSIATNAGAVAGNVNFNGLLILGGNVTITAGAGNVKFGEAVAIGPHDLTVASSTTTEVPAGITGSTGSVDINATAATNVAGAIALSGAGTVTLDRAMINGVDITTVGGTIMFDGPTSTDSGEVAIGTGAGAGHVDFNDTLTLGGNVTITAGAGNVSFDGAVVIGARNLTVVSSSSTNVSAGITGSTGDVSLRATAATNVDGAIALSGAGAVRLDRAVISGANVTTVGGAITLDGPASTDTGPVVIGTGAGGGSVDFNGTLTLGGNMTITAGTGNVDFDGAVSIGTYDLTVVSSASTNMPAGISGSTGSVDVNATAATNVDAAIALSGAGTVRLGRAVIRGVNVTTVGGTITFDGPAGTDTGPVEIGTGAGAGHVEFNGALTLGGDLAITAGAGHVDFDGAVAIGTHDLTVVSSARTTVSSGISGSTSNIDINATAATNVDGAIALSGAGTVMLDRAVISGVDITTVGGTIMFDGPTSTDSGEVAIGTGAGAGHVGFDDTLTLGGNVTITAGAGNVSFDGAVMIGARNLTVASSSSTTVAAGITGSTGDVNLRATAATNVDGTIALSGAGTVRLDRAVISGADVTTVGGAITFAGPASTDTGPVVIGTGAGGGDVDFDGILTLGGNMMITAGTGNVDFDGAVSIGTYDLTVVSSASTNLPAGISGSTGSVDVNATAVTNVDAAIALSGAGTVRLGRAVIRGVNVTTVGGTITFDGPVSTDTGPIEIGTGAGAGHVEFNGALTLGGNLAITAGAGHVDFDGAVSIGTHDLTVASSARTTVSSGISGSTSNIHINATAATNVDGAIALSGAGTVTLDRAVISGVDITTVGGAITFDGPTSTDEGPSGIGTGAGDGHILFAVRSA